MTFHPIKFNQFKSSLGAKVRLISGIALLLSIAVAPTSTANSRPAVSPGPSPLLAQVQATIAFSGSFVAAEAPTTGTAQIVEADGQRYLVLDSAFSTTDQAPDLQVILETAEVPPSSYTDFGSFVNLGGLQQVSGEQRYPIPDAINLSQFKSVAIWCRMANATMGYATLGEARNARIQ